jgi:alpha-tubulin suppressor-like RCC1 family protein
MFSCALQSNGEAVCWGDASFEQASPPKAAFQSIEAGGRHICGVERSGEVICWGTDEHGQSTVP